MPGQECVSLERTSMPVTSQTSPEHWAPLRCGPLSQSLFNDDNSTYLRVLASVKHSTSITSLLANSLRQVVVTGSER